MTTLCIPWCCSGKKKKNPFENISPWKRVSLREIFFFNCQVILGKIFMKKHTLNQKKTEMYCWKLRVSDNFFHCAIWHNGVLSRYTRNISPLPPENIEVSGSFTEIPVLWKLIEIMYYSSMLMNVCKIYRKGTWVASRNEKIKMY